MSQVILMGIFVVTPRIPGMVKGETTEDLHFYMRLHSGCFLQFVPVLCLAMSSNYIEAALDPKVGVTCTQWIILFSYVLATILETIFATCAIFWYEGPYLYEGREKWFVLPPKLMMTIDYIWFLSLPLAASFQPMAPNIDEHFGTHGVDWYGLIGAIGIIVPL